MPKIQDIETAVMQLPKSKLSEFRKWFYDYDTKVWDEKFERNVKDGKLDSLADKAIKDFKVGKCKKM